MPIGANPIVFLHTNAINPQNPKKHIASI